MKHLFTDKVNLEALVKTGHSIKDFTQDGIEKFYRARYCLDKQNMQCWDNLFSDDYYKMPTQIRHFIEMQGFKNLLSSYTEKFNSFNYVRVSNIAWSQSFGIESHIIKNHCVFNVLIPYTNTAENIIVKGDLDGNPIEITSNNQVLITSNILDNHKLAFESSNVFVLNIGLGYKNNISGVDYDHFVDFV